MSASTIVYDNGSFDATKSGQIISSFAIAEDFTLASVATLDTLTFRAFGSPLDSTFSSFNGTVGWAFHSDVAGLPGAIIASGADLSPTLTDTGQDNSSLNRIFQLDVDLGTVNLGAGTYWLQIREGAIGSPFDGTIVVWIESTSGLLGSHFVFEFDEENPIDWSLDSGSRSLAFQLTQFIPEPSTFVLAALGLLSLGLVGWRRRGRS